MFDHKTHPYYDPSYEGKVEGGLRQVYSPETSLAPSFNELAEMRAEVARRSQRLLISTQENKEKMKNFEKKLLEQKEKMKEKELCEMKEDNLEDSCIGFMEKHASESYLREGYRRGDNGGDRWTGIYRYELIPIGLKYNALREFGRDFENQKDEDCLKSSNLSSKKTEKVSPLMTDIGKVTAKDFGTRDEELKFNHLASFQIGRKPQRAELPPAEVSLGSLKENLPYGSSPNVNKSFSSMMKKTFW